MVDPAAVLPSFQSALRQARIQIAPSPADPALYLHVEEIAGLPRLTYVHLQKRTVTALVMFAPVEPIDGIRTFTIGYAVPQLFRKKGRGTEIVKAALTDFRLAMVKAHITTYYVEAIIAATNTPSLRIASKLLSAHPKEITETASGKPAFHYVGRFSIDLP